jgi:hypothetical protein
MMLKASKILKLKTFPHLKILKRFDMEVTFRNRYNDTLTFALDGNEIKVTGYSHPIRTGFNTTGTKIDFVDPPGGPWLHTGMGLGIIDSSLKDKIVDGIRLEEDFVVLTVSKK